MVLMNVLGLALLALPVAAELNLTAEILDFNVESSSKELFIFNRQEFYKLLGPDGFICLNLTTSEEVEVNFGSCQLLSPLGKFNTGVHVLKESFVEHVMDFALIDKNCYNHSVAMQIYTGDKAAEGNVKLFSCYEEITKSIPSKLDQSPKEKSVFKHVPTTWSDKYRQFRFQLRFGNAVVEKFNLKSMLDTAIGGRNRTVCFDLKGVTNATVYLNRCLDSEPIKVLVYEEKLEGLEKAQLHAVAEMALQKCHTDLEMNEWNVTVITDEKYLQSGSLSLFSCRRIIEEQNRLRYESAARMMGLYKKYYYTMKKYQISTISADIKGLIDTATSDKQGRLTISVDVHTNNPVNVLISRCSYLSHNSYTLSESMKSEYFELSDRDLQLLQNLSKSPKCGGEEESDDAMYLILMSRADPTIGSVQFELTSTSEEIFEKKVIERNVYFDVARQTTLLKSVELEHVFDDGVMNNYMIGLNVETTNRISLYVSKCQFSPRQLVAENVTSGIVHIRHFLKLALFRLFDEPACDSQDGMEYTLGYLHVEGLDKDAKGFVQFVRLNTGQKIKTTEFVELETSRQSHAARNTKEMNITYTADEDPQEIDLRYFVEAIRAEPILKLSIEHSYPTDLTVTFHKCKHVDHSNLEFGYQVLLNNAQVLTSDQVSELRYILKSRRCDNKSRYGIFAVINGTDYTGSLSFSIGKYGRKIRRNEYFLVNELPKRDQLE